MRTRDGDLLALAEAGEFDVIVHGCNCQHTMGAGIARAIRERFPEAFEADLRTPHGGEKLGTISVGYATRGEHQVAIVNAYTQVHWRGRGKKVSEEAVSSSMELVQQRFSGKRIGYPKIGAGLGGGDWSVLGPIIEQALDGEDHTLVVLPAAPRP